MRTRARISLGATALAAAVSGCAVAAPVPDAAEAPDPAAPIDYRGIETRLLEGDLVNFRVTLSGGVTGEAVDRYARCAAAQYALIRGFGFARHLRTNIAEEGGIWRGDAIYTISPALPRGLRTIDAEVVAADCAENDIPMV